MPFQTIVNGYLMIYVTKSLVVWIERSTFFNKQFYGVYFIVKA